MIGGAVLIVGLLLILAGLMAARIPGEATFASSGMSLAPEPEGDGHQGLLAIGRRARNPIRAFLLSPIHPATWHANTAIGLGFPVGVFAFAALASLASAGFATILAGIGVLFIIMGIEGSRLVARIERRRVMLADHKPLIAHQYRPLRGSLVDLIRAEFGDESRWRDVLYVVVNFPLAILEFVVVTSLWALALWLLTMPLWFDAVPGATLPSYLDWLSGRSALESVIRPLAGAVLLPIAASVSQLVMTLHRAVVSGLLCTSESRQLRQQVQTLKDSRSAVLDVEASELRRIERDLHDGAQQRLVMLTLDLGLASERIDSDPEAAKRLVLEGQEQARQALAEIRSLVRGLAPAILLDRGLVAALWSVAAHTAVPTTVESGLDQGERLPDAIERAAYFVASEALANVAKHSAATRCEVRVRRHGDGLVVEIWDDGVGGARVEPGGGLAGLASRVAGVDGSFEVVSPESGGTLVRATLPVAAWGTTAQPADYWQRQDPR